MGGKDRGYAQTLDRLKELPIDAHEAVDMDNIWLNIPEQPFERLNILTRQSEGIWLGNAECQSNGQGVYEFVCFDSMPLPLAKANAAW